MKNENDASNETDKITASPLSAEEKSKNRQNDWYTGIHYHSNESVKEITVSEKRITAPISVGIHDTVSIIYVKDGLAGIFINGLNYSMKEGALFCLYSHHLYSVGDIVEPLHIVQIDFYIGFFMYMSWEKHPKNANAALVYDTCPAVYLSGVELLRVESLIKDILEEHSTERFEGGNLIAYKTLELHTYYCRYIYEQIGTPGEEKQVVWSCIERLLLSPEKELPLKALAQEAGCTPETLTARIKRCCGYTPCQLHQLGRVYNARALLRFSQLSIEYISEQSGFASIQDFCRVFARWFGITPGEFRTVCAENHGMPSAGTEFSMQILQYLHQHFSEEISEEILALHMCVKSGTIRRVISNHFGCSLLQLLRQIRVRYACSLLLATSKTVLDIAVDCGFESYAAFRRAFLTEMNESPAQYRGHKN